MLTAGHRAILETLLDRSASPAELRRAEQHGREFDDLRHERLIVYWPAGAPRPVGLSGADLPGRWYVSDEGRSVLGQETTPLRLEVVQR